MANNEAITLSWLDQMDMAQKVASDKSRVLDTLTYRNGQAIVVDALSPDWYERKDGELKKRASGERVRLTHPIVRGDQELGYSESYTYNSEGRQVRSIEGQRVLNRKYNDSAIQMFSEWLKEMTAIPSKPVLYWHAAYAINTRLALESDWLFQNSLKQLGIENREKLRFFVKNQRDSKGLRSPEYISALWDNENKAESTESAETKTAIEVAFEANGATA